MQAALVTANAQGIKREQLVGTWNGSITTVYEGVKDETPITINFENSSTVTLTMLVPQKAEYTVEGNTIRITFNSQQYEPLTLENVRLSQNSMVADGHFPSDPSSISNRLILSRTDNDSRANTYSPNGFCGKTDLSPNVQIIFDRYQIKCPINILENSRWYNFTFFESFLRDLIEEVQMLSWNVNHPSLESETTKRAPSVKKMKQPVDTAGAASLSSGELSFWNRIKNRNEPEEFTAYLKKYPTGRFSALARRRLEGLPTRFGWASRTDSGVVIIFYDEQSMKAVQDFITPILEDPAHLTFELLSGGHGAGSVYYFDVDHLKPEFRDYSRVKLDKVWTEVVNAALPLGINLDAKTFTQKENTTTISQTVPRRINELGGYIYFEYVTVRMEDRSGKRESLSVEVKSKIIKRKGYSSLVHSIDCNLNNAESTTCSEQPYMKAIISALIRED
jgi:hypothetical protein